MNTSGIYPPIDRGTSIKIPVKIQNVDASALNLTGYKVLFTVKKVPFDTDKEDIRAYIKKDFEPQDPDIGGFAIELTAADTNLDPGEYFFDIVLTHEQKGAWRACQMKFTLIGGVSNRQSNMETEVKIQGNPITLIVTPKKPVVITVPTGPSL